MKRPIAVLICLLAVACTNVLPSYGWNPFKKKELSMDVRRAQSWHGTMNTNAKPNAPTQKSIKQSRKLTRKSYLANNMGIYNSFGNGIWKGKPKGWKYRLLHPFKR